MRHFAIFTFMMIMGLAPAQANVNVTNWSKVNIIGAIETPLSNDLWHGYTQDKALQTLAYFPKILRSPAYKSAIRKLLLSPAVQFNDEIDSPLFLAKRIEMLIQYGLFDDAQRLYDAAGDVVQLDFDLALMGVALTMTQDDLPAACLDIKTLATQFQNMPAWRELSNFCNARFVEEKALSAKNLKFKHYPLLKYLLAENVREIPKEASVIETLIAFTDNRIPESTYNKNARYIDQANDLFVKLALNHAQLNKETYQCYVIESATRGLISTEQVANLYKKALFDEDMINGKNKNVSMHPCAVPAFFYQRLETTSLKKIEIPLLFQSTDGISPHALVPFASDILKSYDFEDEHGWRASIILALNNHNITKTKDNLPIYSIMNAESISLNDAIEWKKRVEISKFYQLKPFDLALPVYISNINSGDFGNLQKNKVKIDYENLFSLTYVNKTLHSGIGNYDALSHAIDKDDVPRALLIALSGLGRFQPTDIHPNAIAVILSSFGEVKLDKEKQTLAIEALH